jgi:hypothetical protein
MLAGHALRMRVTVRSRKDPRVVEIRTIKLTIQFGYVAQLEKKIATKRTKEDADEEARLALREQKKREWEDSDADCDAEEERAYGQASERRRQNDRSAA